MHIGTVVTALRVPNGGPNAGNEDREVETGNDWNDGGRIQP